MRSRLFLAVLFLSLSFIACDNKDTDRALQDIESYIQTRPDSALTAIRAIDTLGLRTGELRAKYSLLLAMALDKNYIDTTDISIIQPALDYYTPKRREATLSKYYAARIYENAQDYDNAIIYFILSLDSVSEEDNLYQGLICASLADVYHKSYCFAEELLYKEKSLEYIEALGDSTYIDLALFGLANAWHNNHDFHKADSLYQVICNHGDSLRPIALSSKIAMADNAIKSGNYDPDRVLKLYEFAIDHSGEMTIEDYYEYAYLLSKLNRYQEADKLLEQLSAFPTTYISTWWRYKIEKLKCNHEEAENLLEESIALQDQQIWDKVTKSVFKSQTDYYKHAMLSARQEKIILRQRFTMVFLLMVVLLSFALLLFLRKKRMMDRENDRLLLAMEESEKMLGVMKLDFEQKYYAIQEESVAQRKKVLELQKMYAGLYQKQFSEIGKNYDASYLNNPDRTSQKISKQVASEISNILSEISAQSSNHTEFEARINRDADNIIAKIRIDYPRYSDDDIRLICYLVAGFDATTISVLMNITGENARVKKHRIRGRLLRDKGENSELYRLWLE